MGKVKVSVINERKMLGYHKDCCMAIETCYAEYHVLYWIDTGEAGVLQAQDEGVRAIKEAFEDQAIEMPYPTRTILMAEGNRS